MKQFQPNKKKVLTIDSDAMAMTSEVTAPVNFFLHHVIYVLVAEETGFLFFGGGIIQIRKKKEVLIKQNKK